MSSSQISAPIDAPLMGDFIANQHSWLTANEAAAYLKIQCRTLLAWARAGKVKGFVLSGHRRHVWRFRTVDLDAMLLGPAVLNSQEGE